MKSGMTFKRKDKKCSTSFQCGVSLPLHTALSAASFEVNSKTYAMYLPLPVVFGLCGRHQGPG